MWTLDNFVLVGNPILILSLNSSPQNSLIHTWSAVMTSLVGLPLLLEQGVLARETQTVTMQCMNMVMEVCTNAVGVQRKGEIFPCGERVKTSQK